MTVQIEQAPTAGLADIQPVRPARKNLWLLIAFIATAIAIATAVALFGATARPTTGHQTTYQGQNANAPVGWLAGALPNANARESRVTNVLPAPNANDREGRLSTTTLSEPNANVRESRVPGN